MSSNNLRLLAMAALVFASLAVALAEDAAEQTLRAYMNDVDLSLSTTSRAASAEEQYCTSRNTVDASVFDTMSSADRETEYRRLHEAGAKCVKDANGVTRFWGLRAVTKQRRELNSLYAKAYTSASQIGVGRETCQMLSISQILALFSKISQPLVRIAAYAERRTLLDHVAGVYWNKRRLYARDGRQQIGGDKVCWEYIYGAIYSEYVIGVVVKKNRLGAISRLQTLQRLGLYDDHIDHVSTMVANGGAPDDVWTDHMVREGRMTASEGAARLGAGNRTATGNMVTVSHQSSCHPICKMTMTSMRFFDYVAYKSCCSQCYGSDCIQKPSTRTLLRFGVVYSIAKPVAVTTRVAETATVPVVTRVSLWL